MAIIDYASLVTAIKSWAARSDSTFSNRIDDFIGLAETRMNNGQGEKGSPLFCPGLAAPELETSAAVTITSGSGLVPSDASTVRTVYRSGDESGLTYISPRQWELYNAQGNTDLPTFYTIDAGTLKIAPTYTGTINVKYFKTVTPLTVSNTTTTILTKYPFLYLEGCLFEAFTFMQEVETALGHFEKYKSIVTGINTSAATVRFGGGPLRIRNRNPLP